MPVPTELRHRLAALDQLHVLSFYDQLDPAGQARLVRQLESLDLERIPSLVEGYVKRKPVEEVGEKVEPSPYYPKEPTSARPWDRAAYRAEGERLLRAGKVAAFTVAGGQGSRLGYEGPKGCYPGGAVSGRPLFGIFADGLVAASRRYGKAIPWYIMTSPLNHEATIEFFEKQGFFGLPRQDVMFFPQGTLPSFDMESGKLLLAARDEVATNPDGHGGALKALFASGAIDDMKRRGVAHISYFQVDNPLVRVVDPVFLGLHAAAPDSSAEMSSKMVPKARWDEAVGVFCSVGGKTRVIEYSDLSKIPGDLAKQTNPDGSLRFNAGSIAVHAIAVEFVARLNTDTSFDLPYHRAEKKVAFVDVRTGETVMPSKANAVKLERFVFDALALARKSIVLETDRIEEFAPIKNATGVDSVESSRQIQTERAARWLERVGVRVPRGADGAPECTLEVSPLSALEAEDLRGRALPTIERGSAVVV
ncbi:MAG: UDPGP type 1 family protein [Phycisphaerae bacterium]|nr:UDPGP type 1 family protein [Phycisphaerae bacterium]